MFLSIFTLSTIFCKAEDTKLWYKRPAKEWVEALPLGNSRLGAMVFGNPAREQLQLNEETMWGGGPHRNDSPNMLKVLDEVRSLIFAGKEKEEYILRAKCLIVTSLWHETFGLVVAEMKMYGIPSIVPIQHAASEQIANNKDGLKLIAIAIPTR